MKKAILIPYSCYQNEPSVPFNNIYDIPDDIEHRDKMLIDLFLQRVSNDEDNPEEYRKGVYVTNKSRYGDLHVTDRSGDCYLFVTFIKG